MGLETYRKKRDFSRTSEPSGPPPKKRMAPRKAGATRTKRGPAAAKAPMFVIQKHAARRLHYDFRLEMDGVLKSWAVPKGPSLDPKEKRLAVQVEDHPIDYADFEGTIPRGEYGAGNVIVWDRGVWAPSGDPHEGLARGKLKITLAGEKLRGGFTLVRMGGRKGGDGSWLLMKEADAEARPLAEGDALEERPESVITSRTLDDMATGQDVKPTKRAASGPDPARIEGARQAPLPRTPEPQLATLVDRAPVGPGWVYELKYDGYRVLASIEDGEARFVTRNGKDWSRKFVALKDAVESLPLKSAVLDGEVAVLRSDGTTDFQALQNALRQGNQAKLVYFVFDLLYLDGQDLRGARLGDRKAALAQVLAAAPAAIRYSDHLEGDGTEVRERACKLALEGVIAKRIGGKYHAGRAHDWLKLKCQHRQELVIGGYTDPSGSRAGFGALLIGVHDAKGQLMFSGKTGTGFTAATLRDLHEKLQSLETPRSPFVSPPRMRGVHWVEPKLVAEVQFTGWTQDGRLRHPSFLGLREDRKAVGIVREVPQRLDAEDESGEGEAMAGRKAGASNGASGGKKQAAKAAAPGGAKSKGAAARSAPGKDDGIAGVRLSHPDKVLYPEDGHTKRDLAHYYEAVADHILPHVADRPMTLVRCPEGLGKPSFFQKHASQGLHEAVRPVPITDKGGPDTYMAIDSLAGLIAFVQMGALELHVWGSRTDRLEQPDRLVFDLDPAPELSWVAVMDGARAVRAWLEDLGLVSYVKTTGGKGLHVVVPITRGRADWDEAKAFTKAVATAMATENPTLYTAIITKARRTNKIFIDYLRNGRGATAVAAFSSRARPGATVSTPLHWDELDAKLDPGELTITTVPRRLARLRKDAWEGFSSVRQSITAEMKRRVGMTP